MTEEVNAPALGYSILANLGDDKQLTVQCFADSEEPLSSIHTKLDKAMAVVDRQKAKYRLKDLAKELADTEAALTRQQDDLVRLEEQFAVNQEALDQAIRDATARRDEISEAAYGKGRSGPVGADKATFNALKTEISNLTEQKAKSAAERKQARENLAVSVGRFEDHINKLSAQIDECQSLIAGGGS